MLKKILYCACLCCFTSSLAIAQASGRADFKIDGRLVDAVTNQPIAHARVAVAPVTERDAFTTIVTAEDGLFSFSGLKAGKYALSAQAHGYLFQSFNQHDQYASSIVVGEGASSSGLIFRLSKENIIEGTVSDEAGEPVRNAQITLYQTGTAGGSQGTRVRNRATTNDEGVYHFGHLPGGDYMVSVVAEVWYARRNVPRRNLFTGVVAGQGGTFNFSSMRGGGDVTGDSVSSEPESSGPLDLAYPLSYFPGVTEPASASVIHLTRGERYVADFNVQPVRALHLKIPSPGGPQSSVHFNLSQKMIDGSVVAIPTHSTRLPSGESEIDGIAPGHYTLTATAYTPPEAGAKPGLVTQSTSTREIDALSNGVVEEGRTVAYPEIKARLVFEPGASVPGRSSLQLYDFKTRQNIGELIPANGEVEFKQNILPGSYEVSINGNGSSYIRSIVATGAKTYGRTVVIRGGAPVRLEIAIARGQAQINGVALRDGQPLAGVMIVAVPNDPAHNQVLFRRDQSDSDGTFSLPNVVPGDYTLLAIDNGWDLQWLKPDVLKPYLAQGEAVQVKQNGKYQVKLKVQ